MPARLNRSLSDIIQSTPTAGHPVLSHQPSSQVGALHEDASILDSLLRVGQRQFLGRVVEGIGQSGPEKGEHQQEGWV